jgi:hypothetical protein
MVTALRRSGSLYHLPAVTRFETTVGVASKSSEFQYLYVLKTPFSKFHQAKIKVSQTPVFSDYIHPLSTPPRKEIKLQRGFMFPFTLTL